MKLNTARRLDGQQILQVGSAPAFACGECIDDDSHGWAESLTPGLIGLPLDGTHNTAYKGNKGSRSSEGVPDELKISATDCIRSSARSQRLLAWLQEVHYSLTSLRYGRRPIPRRTQRATTAGTLAFAADMATSATAVRRSAGDT